MAEVYATGPNGQRYRTRQQYLNARTGYRLTAARRRRRAAVNI